MGSGGLRVASPLGVFARPDEAVAAVQPHHAVVPRSWLSSGAKSGTTGISHRSDGGRALSTGAGAPRRISLDCRPVAMSERLNTPIILGFPRRSSPDSIPSVSACRSAESRRSSFRRWRELPRRMGAGDVRITTGQDFIVPNVAEARLPQLIKEPILQGASARSVGVDARAGELHRHRLLPYGADRNEGARAQDRARARAYDGCAVESC